MQKLFENWRRYVSEATIGGQSLPYSDKELGSSIGGQSIPEPEVPDPVPDPEEKCPDGTSPPCTKTLVKVLDSFQVGPNEYAQIMYSLDKDPATGKPKKTKEEYELEYRNISLIKKEKIKTIVQRLLGSQDIGIDRERITFTGPM